MQLNTSNEVYGDFGLPKARALDRRDFAFALAIAVALMLLCAQLTTQWLASRLNHQRALGNALTDLAGIPLYTPWSALRWRTRLPATQEGEQLRQITGGALQFTTTLGLVAMAATLVRRRRAKANRSFELHGTAHWARPDEVERAGLLHGEGIVLGQWEDPSGRLQWLRNNNPDHVLFFGPSGSGKDVGPLMSTFLTCRDNMFILDPKGESHALSSGWRATFSNVITLNFSAAPGTTARWNPLAEVRLGTSSEVADVQRIAQSLVRPNGEPETGSEAGDYFATTAASLLTGAILHVLYRERAQGRTGNLAQVAAELADPNRTHSQVLNEWLTFQHAPDGAYGWNDSGHTTLTHPLVAAAAREQKNRSDKERSPILSTATAALTLYRDPVIAANTACSDFALTELQSSGRPTTLYMVTPFKDEDRIKPLVRLLLAMTVQRLTEDATFKVPDLRTPLLANLARRFLSFSRRTAARITQATGAPARMKPRITFVLNEFTVLGRIAVVERALAIARGWGLRFFICVQDYEQLVAAFGKNETISSNTALRIAYAPNKLETAKLLSGWAGVTTVLKRNESNGATVGLFASKRASESFSEVKRELVTPDECMRLDAAKKRDGLITEAGDMLIFAAGHAPLLAKQPLYFLDPLLVYRARMKPADPARALKAVTVADPPPALALVPEFARLSWAQATRAQTPSDERPAFRDEVAPDVVSALMAKAAEAAADADDSETGSNHDEDADVTEGDEA